jgi:hypothetical protein
MRRCLVLVVPGLEAFVALRVLGAGSPEETKSAREALRPFDSLIGSWRGTGEPHGTREEKQRGFWEEAVDWQWKFKGKDAWLAAAFDKGKTAEIRRTALPAGRQSLRIDRANGGERKAILQGRWRRKS